MAAWRSSETAAPRRAARPRGRFVPAAIIGLGKLGGRELTTGSDLDLFVVYGGAGGSTDGARAGRGPRLLHRAVEALAGAPGRHHRGRASRSRWTCACGRAPRAAASPRAVDALERYYREWADPWERQTLTRARLVGGDPRLGRRCGGASAALLYGPEAPPPDLKEMRALRERMESELGKETPGRFHVKFGRGGLVDVEFITQALQMRPRRARTPACAGPTPWPPSARIAAAGLLPPRTCDALAEQYRFLRRVSLGLRLFGTRPSDTLERGGPEPGAAGEDARLSVAQGLPRRLSPPRGMGPRALRSRRAAVSRGAAVRVRRARRA